MQAGQSHGVAERNVRRFIAFRTLFNSRFYYPVLAVLFLDLGVSASEYALLNVVWAVVIVFAEVPSGALADRFGRRPLVVGAALLMVVEMLVLLVAPIDGGALLLTLCVVNRVLSGLAEALASGADESLVYDALLAESRHAQWPDVMASVMRWQSAGMFVAMLVGAAVYDPQLVNRALAFIGVDLALTQGDTLRLPLALNLLSALLALFATLGMREPSRAADAARHTPAGGTWTTIVDAGAWIVASPVALFAIVGGVVIDSVIRVFLTFGSVYFRAIELPEASFGVVGALMAALGLIVAPVARRFAVHTTLLRNYAVIAALTLGGLTGVAFNVPLWGVLFAVPLAAAMSWLGYFVSNTLNAAVDSARRATVLSFKGLVFNLGYGFASLVFALALRALRDGGSAEQAFAWACAALPIWLAACLALLACAFRRRAAQLHERQQGRGE